MPDWFKIIIPAFIPAFFWAISDAIARFGSDKINSQLGTASLALGMFLTLLMTIIWTNESPINLVKSESSKMIAVMFFAGVLNGIGFYNFIKFLAKGGNFTQGFPMIAVFIILITSIIGITMFNDTFTIRTFAGFIFGAIAIYLLG